MAAITGLLIAAPATSASATAIDCSYCGPGLKSYIGDGREGYTCQGSGTGSGSGTGFHSVTTAGAGQAVPGGFCPAGAIPPVIPDEFYDHGYISTYTTTRELPYERPDSPASYTSTKYYRSGRFVGVRDIVLNSYGQVIRIMFHDLTLQGPDGAGVFFFSLGTCTTGWDITSGIGINAPYRLEADGAMAPPSTPIPADAPHEVLTMGSLTPVPFSSGKYFLRVDVTNNDIVDRASDIDVDLSAFSLTTIAALPSDGSCPFATATDEHCAVGSLAPGATKTFTFVVQTRPAAAPSAPLQIQTEFSGFDRVATGGYVYHEVVRSSFVNPPAP